MSQENLAPWMDHEASDWIKATQSWRAFTTLIRRTLENDPRRFPQQIRAAAGMVILLCRSGLWPTRSESDIEDLVSLARRQLSQVRQLLAAEARHNPEITGSHDYRVLMKTLDEEMRCLDARKSDQPLNMPNEPPTGWGKFFP